MKTNYWLLYRAVKRKILLCPDRDARFFVLPEDMALLDEVLENAEIQRLQRNTGVRLRVFTRKGRKINDVV